jgi:DNA-binding HxlR family transcriptional regulator
MSKLDYNHFDELFFACTGFFSRKWQLSIIVYLTSGPKYFGEILSFHDGLSKKMLSTNLHKLESKGVIKRKVYDDEKVKRVEYSLTEEGWELVKILEQLQDWGIRYAPQDKRPPKDQEVSEEGS